MAYGLYGKYKWSDLNYDTLIGMVNEYNGKPENIDKIRRAYAVAKFSHRNVRRASGEPYITHPVIVANFLAIMKCDVDTICAGLLHDTIEDTSITKEQIEERFGKDVAEIVEGVTKITRMDNLDQSNLMAANTKKLVDSLLYDPRIMIVKLADRLHNMLTISFKTEQKQRSKSYETLAYFAPLANRLGMYRIQKELENASLRALEQLEFNELVSVRTRLKERNILELDKMLATMREVITENIGVIGHCENELVGLSGDELRAKKEELTKERLFIGRDESRTRIKHLYGMYVALKEQGSSLEEVLKNTENLEKIHDLRVIKLVFRDEISCYDAVSYLGKVYKVIDKYHKNYINNPKYNGYQSLHETVSYKGKLVQFQLRTLEQEHTDTFGLAWELYKLEGPDAREKILEKFKKFPIYDEIESMRDVKLNDYEDVLINNVLSDRPITVINRETGETVSLKEHSTIHDYAYEVGGDNGIHLKAAVLNDELIELRYDKKGKPTKYYPFDIELKNGDEISVYYDPSIVTSQPSKKQKQRPKEKSKILGLKKEK